MKKQKKNFLNKKNILGLLIAFVMVSSVLGAWQGSYVAMDKYKDHRFKSKENIVLGKIDGEWIEFSYHPKELESINVSKEALEKIKNSKMIYITFNPNDKFIQSIELTRIEMMESFTSEFNIYPAIAVTEESEVYSAYPVMGCENATSAIPVMYLQESEETNIESTGNCIYMNAFNSLEFRPLKDRIRYSIYGVME